MFACFFSRGRRRSCAETRLWWAHAITGRKCWWRSPLSGNAPHQENECIDGCIRAFLTVASAELPEARLAADQLGQDEAHRGEHGEAPVVELLAISMCVVSYVFNCLCYCLFVCIADFVRIDYFVVCVILRPSFWIWPGARRACCIIVELLVAHVHVVHAQADRVAEVARLLACVYTYIYIYMYVSLSLSLLYTYTYIYI